MVINQGDVYWLDLREPFGSEPGYRHPHIWCRTTYSTAAKSTQFWPVP